VSFRTDDGLNHFGDVNEMVKDKNRVSRHASSTSAPMFASRLMKFLVATN